MGRQHGAASTPGTHVSCRKVSRSSELRLRGSRVRPACSRLSRVERFTNIYGRSSTGPLHVTCMSTCTLHVHVHAHVNLMPIVMFHVPCPCPCMCAPNCDLCVLGKLLSLDIAASLLWWLVTLFPCISVHCGIGHCCACGCIMYRVHGVSLRGVMDSGDLQGIAESRGRQFYIIYDECRL